MSFIKQLQALFSSSTPSEDILKQCNAKVSNCCCDVCKSMCYQCPCIGTPLEMQNIVQAGFHRDVMITKLANPIVINKYGHPITILAINFDEKKGHCSMLENGLCKLHNLGLKPLEGRTAICNSEKETTMASYRVYTAICDEWIKLIKK